MSSRPSTPTRNSFTLDAPNNTPLASPSIELARPSSLSLRPHLGVQTRLRSRSLTSGGGSAPPPVPYLSPTLAGSPTLPSLDNFSDGGGRGPSQLGREMSTDRSGEEQDGDNDDEQSTPPGTEGGSIDSDSPPATPIDLGASPLGRVPLVRVSSSPGEREWARSPQAKERRLEGATRIELRRGKSFTSLLMPSIPLEPLAKALDETITEEELVPSPTTDLESGMDDREGFNKVPPSTLYPPPSSTSTSTPTLSGPPKTLRDFVPQLLILVALFLSSFLIIALLISTLPNLFIPHSISDLPQLTSALTSYRSSSPVAELHVFAVLSALFLWKQCFSIPGSVLTNILFGALYGTGWGCWWACIWTAMGSTGAYGIARVISPLVEHYFATPLSVTRRALRLANADGTPINNIVPVSKGDLFSHLLLARFFPLLPYSVLNVISGVLSLPISIFFFTLVLGSFPFNFVTVSIGSVVALAASDPSKPLTDKIWSGEVLRKLIFVTIISVLPLVFKEHLKRFLGSQETTRALIGFLAALGRFVEGGKNRLVRRLFGFGTVMSSSLTPAGEGVSAPGEWRPPSGEWRRKFNRSWGGNGAESQWRTERVRGLMGRWDGDGLEADMEEGEEVGLLA